MPVYNGEEFVGKAIECILGQTYQNLELLIANDASTDGSAAILESFAAQDSRVVVIDNPVNLYIAGNRNMLMSRARGKYIAWADADDESVPTRLERQVAFLEANPDVAMCGGDLEIFGNTSANGQVRAYPRTDVEIRRKIFRYVPLAQPAAMVRTEAIRAVGEFDLSTPPAEDLDMLFRIGSRYRLGNVEGVVIRYRDHATSATYKRLRTIEKVSVRSRMRNFANPAYSAGVADRLYNVAHWLSIWVMPPKWKITLFNYLRNS
ncbi:hypothetical protein DDE18_01425 [Nocardioides gansuensis]|uniref:Glycosyltransferase 2-like domain-containing protein n=2 Tax=Nocardioides gansuensis TaxID=2138300 RepID=A0A2T8FF47_9ACTN|nr:hypothetical protein DDE18_01425 [Nocardioides gansuensis]